MAAIDLTRLNQQIAGLVDFYLDPPVFQARLHALLDFYHRYSHRKQRDSIPSTFMRVYDLPPQVIPQIEAGLKALPAAANPSATFALADHLWQDDYFEARDLAVFLLGKLPITEEDALLDWIFARLQQPLDRAVAQALLCKASATIQAQHPQGWDNLIWRLLQEPNTRLNNFGLLALILSIPQKSLTEFPAIYRSIRPFLQAYSDDLEVNLSRVVALLAQRSPEETAYLLKEVLADTSGKTLEQRVRSYLGFFDDDLKASLQSALNLHMRISS